MAALMNLFWLVVFVVVGFPAALGSELYLRASRRAARTSPRRTDFPHDGDVLARVPVRAVVADPE